MGDAFWAAAAAAAAAALEAQPGLLITAAQVCADSAAIVISDINDLTLELRIVVVDTYKVTILLTRITTATNTVMSNHKLTPPTMSIHTMMSHQCLHSN